MPVVQTLHNYRLVCSAATFFREGRICETCTPGKPWDGVRHRCYRQTSAGSAAVAWMLWSNCGVAPTRSVDQYVALTRFAADKFVSLGLSADRIRVKPNFVADSGGVGPGGGGDAVFAGRLSDEKGIGVMLEGWQRLRRAIGRGGDGPLRAAAEARVRELELPVRFLGVRPRHEVLDIIGRADVQVVPSECYEGFPLVIVEALARGTPLAVSRLGGLVDIIQSGVTGLHFEPSTRRPWSKRCVACGRIRTCANAFVLPAAGNTRSATRRSATSSRCSNCTLTCCGARRAPTDWPCGLTHDGRVACAAHRLRRAVLLPRGLGRRAAAARRDDHAGTQRGRGRGDLRQRSVRDRGGRRNRRPDGERRAHPSHPAPHRW